MRHAVTGRSTGSGLLDAQHTAHRRQLTRWRCIVGFSGTDTGEEGGAQGRGHRIHELISHPAPGAVARASAGVFRGTRSLAGARPQIRRQSLQEADRSDRKLKGTPLRKQEHNALSRMTSDPTIAKVKPLNARPAVQSARYLTPAATPRPSWAAVGSTAPLRGLGSRVHPCPTQRPRASSVATGSARRRGLAGLRLPSPSSRQHRRR